MADARVGATATLLRDGWVLVAGGFADGMANGVRASAELYDPSSGTWARTGDLLQARAGQAATLLMDGTVLVAGGGTSPTEALNSAEIYDPATGKWSAAPTMGKVRADHTATLLLDGRVLVAGGDAGSGALASAEVFDPTTRKWSATGQLRTARAGANAVRLWTGQVLVAGGTTGTTPLASAELFDPDTANWSATGSMTEPRAAHAGALLDDGRVLVAGGLRAGLAGDLQPQDILASAEVYDPATGKWLATGSMAATRFQFTLTELDDGTVLAAVGDHLGSGPVPGSERYHTSGSWTSAGAMTEPRAAQTATVLDDGDVLVAGGEGPNARGLASAELFDGPAPAATRTLAAEGTMFPGTYKTQFDPSMTLTIDHMVDLDCAPGYRCRGDIDVNLPQWVAFEFGNLHGSELDIYRLDKVYARGDGGELIDAPDDCGAWLTGLPGINVLGDPMPVKVDGLPALRLDVKPDHVVLFGPSGLTPFPDKFGVNGGTNVRARITVVHVQGRCVVISASFGPDNTVGDFDAVARGLQPIVDSIVWN
jgi:hypothetical protein